MEKLSNKMKKRTSAVVLLTAGLWLSGCGVTEANTAQPVQAEGLEALHAVLATPEPTAIPEQESQIEEQQISVEAEAMGNEQETERRTVKAADIYNQPSTDASVLGKVSRRDVVLVIGLAEDEGWYKIDYNGRVAYIQTDVLAATANVSTEPLLPAVTPVASEVPTSTPPPAPTSTPMPTPGKTPAPTYSPAPGITPLPVPTSVPTPSPEVSPLPKPTTVPSVSGNQ